CCLCSYFVIGFLLFTSLSMFVFLLIRPNTAKMHPLLHNHENWELINDEMQNSQVDVIVFQKCLYIAFTKSYYHFSRDSKIQVLKSFSDSVNRETTFSHVTLEFEENLYLTNPKFIIFNNNLLLYVHKNTQKDGGTFVSILKQNDTFGKLQKTAGLGGSFLWKPKQRHNNLYAGIQRRGNEHCRIFESDNGIEWTEYSSPC